MTVCNCGVGDASKAAHHPECPKKKKTRKEKMRAARAAAAFELHARMTAAYRGEL